MNMNGKVETESSSSQEDETVQEAAEYPIDQLFSSCKAHTRYYFMGDDRIELRFRPDQLVTNIVTCPLRRGWIHGTINGNRGLIPECYVEYLPHEEEEEEQFIEIVMNPLL